MPWKQYHDLKQKNGNMLLEEDVLELVVPIIQHTDPYTYVSLSPSENLRTLHQE